MQILYLLGLYCTVFQHIVFKKNAGELWPKAQFQITFIWWFGYLKDKRTEQCLHTLHQCLEIEFI